MMGSRKLKAVNHSIVSWIELDLSGSFLRETMLNQKHSHPLAVKKLK